MRISHGLSYRRMGRAFGEPSSSIGRWLHKQSSSQKENPARHSPVYADREIRARIRALCEEDRHHTYGYRRIRALYARRFGVRLNHKTVYRIMRDEKLTRPRIWHRPLRPKRMNKMAPTKAGQCWQIDMTSFMLSGLVTLFLVVVIDCYSRRIVGWTLSRRCRSSEWIAAVRMGLEAEHMFTKEQCEDLILRSDNGAQPCSKKFVEFLGKRGVKGQYTGYDAPDDNAYVERVIRTIKEEEIWPNSFDTFWEAHEALDDYVIFYNQNRIHSSIGYLTPNEFMASHAAQKAA